jgi:hypothetical protein
MNDHILVCPFDEKLIRRLSRKALVVRTTDFKLIPHINRVVNEQNKLHCIWVVDERRTLTSVPVAEEWKNIPIHIYLSGIGSFRSMVGKLQLLRQLSIRVFLSPGKEKNLTDLMILASLGIDCGIFWDNKKNEEIDWEALNDLMHYAIYSRAKHAPIEPFHYLVSKYNPQKPTDFSSVYFDNPRRYLHIDEGENIALTYRDLLRKNYIDKGISSVDTIEANQKYIEFQTRWQNFFLKTEPCAFCSGWRICLGKFSSTYQKNPGCKDFFSDLMDASDFYRDLKKKEKRELCQL